MARIMAIVNYGTLAQLMELNTVGKKRAETILASRKANPGVMYHTVGELGRAWEYR